MRRRKDSSGRGDEKLIAETKKLREQLTATAERLEVYAVQLQKEVDRLQLLRSQGKGAGDGNGKPRTG